MNILTTKQPGRWILPVVLLFSLTRLSAQDAGLAGAPPLPEAVFPALQRILDQAMTQSPQMLQRNIELAQAEAAVYLGRAGMLPNVGASFSGQSSGAAVDAANASTSRASGFFYSIGVSQPIYHWGTLKAQADINKIGLKISEKNYLEAYRTLASSIRSQYLGLITRKIAVRNAEFSLKLAESTLRFEEDKLRAGIIAPGAVVAPKLAVDDARLARDRAREDYQQYLRYLQRLAGVKEIADADVPDSMPKIPCQVDDALTEKLVSRYMHGGAEETPQAWIYRYTIQQADLNYRIAKYRLYPKLNLSLSYGLSNTTTVSGNSVTQQGVSSQSASIAAGWSLFDGLATRGAKLSALASKRMGEQQLAAYLDSQRDLIVGQKRQLEFSIRSVTLADIRQELGATAVKTAADDLKAGFGSESTLEWNRMAMYQAELSAANARAEFFSRWADFLSALAVDPALSRLPSRFTRHDQ
jgi:outer membrane protein TolC